MKMILKGAGAFVCPWNGLELAPSSVGDGYCDVFKGTFGAYEFQVVIYGSEGGHLHPTLKPHWLQPSREQAEIVIPLLVQALDVGHAANIFLQEQQLCLSQNSAVGAFRLMEVKRHGLEMAIAR